MDSIIPDPIHGRIQMPFWLIRINKEKPIRRMIFIRQLGLKAYIDYPGAIHTRYSHALGVMHLAGKIVDILSEFEKNQGRPEIGKNLDANKDTVMAAGFLHDIGHGPFSHVLDFVLNKYAKSHENIGVEIIREFRELENYGVIINKVNDIITNKHDYHFITQIVNGPIDSDKLDYLLRDAHHVGLKYSFDLEHFIRNFRILGTEKSDLRQCELGLTGRQEGIVSAEIFIVIWKSMYDLVYQIANSRVAEKMIEKAIVLRAEDDHDFKSQLIDVRRFVDLNDDYLLETLKKGKGLSAELSQGAYDNVLYSIEYDEELRTETFSLNEKFINELKANPNGLSDDVSKRLSERTRLNKYEIICDIVKSKMPETINIDQYDELSGEQIELKSRSPIIDAIKGRNKIKVYLKGNLQQKIEKSFISKSLKEIISEW